MNYTSHYDANKRASTANFMDDILKVFEEHGMALVPSYQLKESFHDPLLVVDFDDSVKDFYNKRVYVEE